jgi:hypothetical protein
MRTAPASILPVVEHAGRFGTGLPGRLVEARGKEIVARLDLSDH